MSAYIAYRYMLEKGGSPYGTVAAVLPEKFGSRECKYYHSGCIRSGSNLFISQFNSRSSEVADKSYVNFGAFFEVALLPGRYID